MWGMHRKCHSCGLTEPLDKVMEPEARHRSTSLGNEHVWAFIGVFPL
jgi:hypothetical protein